MTTPLRRAIGGVKLPMVMEKGEVNLLLKKQAQQAHGLVAGGRWQRS